MEKQRERLVELLKVFNTDDRVRCPHYEEPTCEGCEYDLADDCDRTAILADYLLANNVVVLPWEKGDTLYSVTRLVDGKLEPYQINVEAHKFKEIRYFIICENDTFLDSCWGKSLFADKEEAEKYAKNMAEELVLKAKEHLEKAENALKERKENVK